MAVSYRFSLATAFRATAVSLATVIALGGCAQVTPPPMSTEQRAAIRSSILDLTWAEVENQYPEAIRPRVSMGRTVPDHSWNEVVIECLRSVDIVARVSAGKVLYSSSAGQSPVDVAVTFYLCEASHPSQSQVTWFLDETQASALYGYYLDIVRPCLLSAGAPSQPYPAGARTREAVVLDGWNPYQRIWTSGVRPEVLRYLEHRCPPVPTWLNLGAN
ncbi:MAG: hypothetical protein QOI70_1888 [Microbacteriaceae bacterium]|jgi:hypothetical protein|nr:hypothetical protein [Microbacteriaceae bacterium]